MNPEKIIKGMGIATYAIFAAAGIIALVAIVLLIAGV